MKAQTDMGRKSLAPQRRAALITATVQEIHARGTLGVSTQAIAARAGLSAPLAMHYFGSKDAMILAALRDMLARLRRDVVAALQVAQTPRARVSALLRTNFGPEQFRPETISAWLTFYVRAQEDAETNRLLRIYQHRLLSNLRHELRALLPGDRALALADVIAAMIDGFYLRHALREAPPDAETVIARIETIIDLHL